MIVKLKNLTPTILNQILAIWLQGNLDAHSFISSSYWQSNYDEVKKALPSAKIYIAIKNSRILGFLGITHGYIAGLFVDKQWRHHGIGTQLLNSAKRDHQELQLYVYIKNAAAVTFYKRNHFKIIKKQVDLATQEVEYRMKWRKN